MNRRSLCRYAPRAALLAALPVALPAALSACAAPHRDPAEEPARAVFFAGESETLDGPARAVVRAAAEAAQRAPGMRLLILAYGGAGAPFNRALAEARARHVVELLRQAGVPAERILVQGRGPVPAAMAPIESGRVEIRLAAA